jgi:DNA-binding transcriptional regulator GbsR (MarR family)
MTRQEGRDEGAVQAFIERYAAVLTESGFPRMPARIFVALLASERGRLTAAELAEVLHSSPAAISGGVRFLTQNFLASREREPGSRRDVYVVHDDALMESTVNRTPLVARWSAQLREGLNAVGPDTPAGRRVKMNLAFAEFMLDEMEGMVKRWNEHKLTLHLED